MYADQTSLTEAAVFRSEHKPTAYVIPNPAPRAEVVEVLVLAVKDHAIANYEEGGWDVVVECYTDEMIAEALGQARTVEGAIAKFTDIVSIYADRQADAKNSAF